MSKLWSWVKRSRKAIAAFFAPFLGLPILEWISGDVAFDNTLLWSAFVGAITGVFTYYTSNDPEA